jgi:hypothetical protein
MLFFGEPALDLALLRQQSLLLHLKLLPPALRGGEIAARVARLDHRKGRSRAAVLVHIAAAVEVRLREHVGLPRALACLCVDQHDLERLRRLPSNRIGKLEVQRERHPVHGNREPERCAQRSIAILDCEVHSHFNTASLS